MGRFRRRWHFYINNECSSIWDWCDIHISSSPVLYTCLSLTLTLTLALYHLSTQLSYPTSTIYQYQEVPRNARLPRCNKVRPEFPIAVPKYPQRSNQKGIWEELPRCSKHPSTFLPLQPTKSEPTKSRILFELLTLFKLSTSPTSDWRIKTDWFAVFLFGKR